MTISYLDSLQVFSVIFAIKIIGFVCSLLKLFTYKDVSAIRRLMTFVAIPAALFRMIGDGPFGFSLFHPFFNSLLTQLTVHFYIFILIWFIPTPDRRLTFVKISLSATSPNHIFMGYPILQILFGDSHRYVCAMSSIVHFFIVQPLDSIFLHFILPTSQNTDGIVEDIVEQEPSLKEHLSPEQEPTPEANQDSTEVSVESLEESLPQPDPHWKVILWRFVTPINVCTILGLIWSATSWSMPSFLSIFVIDLEKSVVASGLCSIGVFIGENRFSGVEKVWGVVAMLAHVVLIPVVSGMWSWVLGIDHQMAAALVLIHAAPMAWECLTDACEAGMQEQAPKIAFVWGNVLSLPVFMLWVMLLNVTGVFE
jgi:predicted permease